MGFIFWVRQGVIVVDYFQKGCTIDGAYYAEELRRLRLGILRKSRGKKTRGVQLFKDNVHAHTFQGASRSFFDSHFLQI